MLNRSMRRISMLQLEVWFCIDVTARTMILYRSYYQGWNVKMTLLHRCYNQRQNGKQNNWICDVYSVSHCMKCKGSGSDSSWSSFKRILYDKITKWCIVKLRNKSAANDQRSTIPSRLSLGIFQFFFTFYYPLYSRSTIIHIHAAYSFILSWNGGTKYNLNSYLSIL